jgi:hypothetical protein
MGNLVINCLDTQSTLEWHDFKLEYWNHIFCLVDLFFEDNGCMVFIQGVDANFVGQVKFF